MSVQVTKTKSTAIAGFIAGTLFLLGPFINMGMATLIEQDDSAATVSYSVLFPTWAGSASYNSTEPIALNNGYHYFDVNSPVANEFYIWTPGLTGTYKVSSSWPWGAHEVAVNHFFDADGAGAVAEVDLNIILNQTFDAGDGVTQGTALNGGGAIWSGYYTLGTFDLTPASTFRVAGTSNSQPLTAGPWSFETVAVPEPGTLSLILLSSCLLGVHRFRLSTQR